MTKAEAKKEILKDIPIHIEGVDFNEEADEDFINELKTIRDMVIAMQEGAKHE